MLKRLTAQCKSVNKFPFTPRELAIFLYTRDTLFDQLADCVITYNGKGDTNMISTVHL